MPVVNVKCPCQPDPQPCDHWRGDYGCTLPADTHSWYQALLHRQLNDTRHRSGNITVTRLLTCPCEWLLQDYVPYTFDPRNAHTPHVGTLVQAEKARFAPLGWVAEKEVSGELWGLPISASIDLSKLVRSQLDPYGSHKGYINEGKFHSFDKDGYKEWALKPDMIAQVNMQRLLWEQSEPGLRVMEMKVSRDSMSGKASKTFDVPRWSLEQIGAHRPGGGSFTVKQIAGFTKATLAQLPLCKTEDERKQVIADTIPMCCSEMYNGKKREMYMQRDIERQCSAMRKSDGGKW